MLPLIVALFWLAILVPWGIVKFRNSRAERSIDSFHAEHEVLSRQGYSVTPARRLDDAYLYEEQAYEPEHSPERSRPRLTVVHDDDTYSTLESRLSWDEWQRDYDYDEPRSLRSLSESSAHAAHRYAAYATSPSPRSSAPEDFAVLGDTFAPIHHSMKVRRHRVVVSLLLSALMLSTLDYLIGGAALQYLALVSWACVVVYVAAALYAISQGFLEVSSLIGWRVRAYAPIELEDGSADEAYDQGGYLDELDDVETYEAVSSTRGGREQRRYALG